jgi:hypothetical protein
VSDQQRPRQTASEELPATLFAEPRSQVRGARTAAVEPEVVSEVRVLDRALSTPSLRGSWARTGCSPHGRSSPGAVAPMYRGYSRLADERHR